MARRPNFCVNWFPGVFLMSTQFLALKSQRCFSLHSAILGTLWRIHFWTHFSCSLNLIFGNVTNDKLRYKGAVNQYGWERISRYCQTSSTWDICWRNGHGGDWFIPSSKWPSIQLFCFSSWLLYFLLTSRAKLGPQSLVIFAEYKVAFFVSVTYYAWFSVISKEHNITISKVSENLIPVGDIFSFNSFLTVKNST